MSKIHQLLFKQIDNSALIVFRIIFGILLCLESVGAIFTGWVKTNLVDPTFTFNFIGFDWLQPLPGYGMYVYYIIMGILGLFVALGFYYRWSMAGFTLLWTMTYLMQKTAYNNHYYLLIILCLIMVFLPANTYASLDAKRKPQLKSNHMSLWVSGLLIGLIFLVYTYAAIAKIYPDWLDLSVLKAILAGKRHYFMIGELLQQEWLITFLTYGGLVFDLLIALALLYKPTRKIAFGCAIFFHLFNSIVFQVGIFPYLGLAFCLFFFEPETIRTIFLKRKTPFKENKIQIPPNANVIVLSLSVFFLIQLLLPLRHWTISGDVLVTEEGHRMSWRMMLRTKSGKISFRTKALDSLHPKEEIIKPTAILTPKQARSMSTHPDMIWQFAQFLKRKAKEEGRNIAVFAHSKVNINNKGWFDYIDPTVDLGKVKWDHFKHQTWILSPPHPRSSPIKE